MSLLTKLGTTFLKNTNLLLGGIVIFFCTNANASLNLDINGKYLNHSNNNSPLAFGLGVTVSNFNGVNISCNGVNDGTISIAPTGGVNPYTYVWSNGASVADLTGLFAGTYTVTVTDDNGDTESTTVTLTEPNQLILTNSITNVLCNGASTGAIDLTVSGGTTNYSYAWSNGAITEDLTGKIAGTYTVTVTDANSCTATTSATITQPAALNLSTTVTNVLCNGASTGAVNLTVSGGNPSYTYLWSNGAITQIGRAHV